MGDLVVRQIWNERSGEMDIEVELPWPDDFDLSHELLNGLDHYREMPLFGGKLPYLFLLGDDRLVFAPSNGSAIYRIQNDDPVRCFSHCMLERVRW